MVEILMTPLDGDAALVEESATLLSDAERKRADRFARDRDRRRFIVARAELRRQLGERLATPPRTIAFTRGPQGKPGLAEGAGPDHLAFSVSRCGGVAALAFASGPAVGVDIEALRAVPEAEAIAERFCSPAEWRAYRTLAEPKRLRGFFNWWTRKEALVKAQGRGLGQALDTFDVSLSPDEPAALLRAPDDGRPWILRAFDPGVGMVGAVAFTAADAEQVVVRALPPLTAPIAGGRDG